MAEAASKKTICAIVPVDVLRALDEHARLNDRSRSGEVVHALRAYLRGVRAAA